MESSEELFDRAAAAIAEGKRLTEENLALQHEILSGLRRMRIISFHPHSLKLFSPLDFSELRQRK
ncbi:MULTISPECIES: hypothetical protein [unclassified Bradyrhizobium]|uniref:hypothetical protein n=1 Tax=unclassified Bradyrhizobium TaxID=2631580 RepID=UPI002478DCBE|nr:MULTISPECIES: hypothetical protein [unclassified Bradyrhizobium]WGS21101.1 hypothetical protein MTX22_04860 [Bradyrhizobium sp. ISRA463]WGS28019.1 hypothetical protein MTX19_02710 [Bradyrhizobium sp. ISRA464]